MKIPENAKRVFEGVIFDVYQWEQELFDGSKETFEMLKRPNTLQVIATQGDKILLADENQPVRGKFVSLFGGRQDEGEEPLAGCKRELLEEAGLESDDWELYKVFDVTFKIEWDSYIFIARDCKKVAEQKLEPAEDIKILSVSFEEFLDIVEYEKFRSENITNEIRRMKLQEGELAKFKKLLFK